MLNYKKPTVWVSIVAAIAVVAVIICFVFSSSDKDGMGTNLSEPWRPAMTGGICLLYTSAGTEPISIKNQHLIAWLLEAVLYAKGVTSLSLLSVIEMCIRDSMKGWRQRILNELNMCFERIAVAFDLDGLLREEKTANEIKKIGFDIVVFEDSIEFRYVYESRYRDAFEGAQTNDLIAQARKLLVVVPNPDDRRRVPFDVLSKAQEFSYGLADIFPQLSYNIVSQLELDQLDMLWDAVIRENPDRLGENFTKEFVMKHVFQMKLPDSLTSDEDLLVTLMDRHYKNLPIPEVLETWYIDALRREGLFSDWPIEILMSNRRSFLDFLQERWALFLERNMEIQVAEGYRVGTEETLLKIPGPIDIPFDSEDIRVRLDNFFLEGLLEPCLLYTSRCV